MKKLLIVTSTCLIFLISCSSKYALIHSNPERDNENTYNIDASNCDMYAQQEKMNAYYAMRGNPFAGLGMIAAYDSAFENCMGSKGWLKVSEEEAIKRRGTYSRKTAEPTSPSTKNDEHERQQALEYFNANVKPKILKIHPDFDDIVLKKTPDGKLIANDEFFEWAEKQRPALRFAAMESNNPDDIIWAISEYKKFKQGGNP